jgi:serpin B
MTISVGLTLVWSAWSQAQKEASAGHRAAAESSNAFALSVYQTMTSAESNLVFCPYGLHRLMTLVREGAEGQTAAELDRGLHWTVPQEERIASHTALARALGSSLQNRKVALRSTSRLWVSDKGVLEPAFREVAVQHYAVRAETLDFTNAAAAIASMNSAIAGDTNGRVPALMGPGSVAPDTTLVLAHSVYFKGLWESRFDARRSSERVFYTLKQSIPRPTAMMHQTASFDGMESSEHQAVSLPFSETPDLSMIFLLPVKRDGLREMEAALTVTRVQQIVDAMVPMQVTMALPRFSFSVSGSYKGMLSGTGIHRVFDRAKAELEGISREARPHLSELIHETLIEVNESGAEAESAMAAPAGPFGPPPEVRRMLFNADHPFVFMVRHRPTGLILFMGRYAGP